MLKLILKGFVILLVVAVVAFASAALVVPKKKSFTQETEINVSRETVWKVLNDREKYTEWQDQLTKVEIKDDKHWSETTVDGQILLFTLVSSEEPTGMRISYNIGENFKGAWSGELRRVAPDKTIIRTTDSTEIDSVIMKVTVAIFFDIEDFAKEWNQKLKKRAESLSDEGQADN